MWDGIPCLLKLTPVSRNMSQDSQKKIDEIRHHQAQKVLQLSSDVHQRCSKRREKARRALPRCA